MRHIVLLLLALVGCGPDYFTQATRDSAPAWPDDATGSADGTPDGATPQEGGPDAQTGLDGAAQADGGVTDTGAKDAGPPMCTRKSSYDWICNGYQFGRVYAWDCPTMYPQLPTCSGGQCNCQGSNLYDKDAGWAYFCCDLPN